MRCKGSDFFLYVQIYLQVFLFVFVKNLSVDEVRIDY